MSNLSLHHTKNRFSAFFWTQFLGAFNDNYFKVALTMLATYRMAGIASGSIKQLVFLSAGLFILPFFLFSALAGQIADKFPKTTVIQWVKFCEILVMLLAVAGFVLGNIYLLLMVLFLMGAQSAFFGPVKYSIIPELLHEDELIKGNGLVSMGTFVSILVGTILGGPSIAIGAPLPGDPAIFMSNLLQIQKSIASAPAIILTSSAVIATALLGYLFSKKVPYIKAADPALKINKNIFQQTFKSLRYIKQEKTIFWSIMAIAWFWLYGALVLQLIPTYTRDFLLGDEIIFTLALTMFSLGIGTGALLCEKLAKGVVEPGLFPLGALGLILLPPIVLFANKTIFIILPGLLLIGFFAGLFIVPLYSILQDRCRKKIRAQTIAASGILDALFMVLATGLAMLLTGLQFNEPQIFAALALLTAIFLAIFLAHLPEFTLRFLMRFCLPFSTKAVVQGEKHIPIHGKAIVQGEYNTLKQALLISLAFRRWPAIFLPKNRTKPALLRRLFYQWANIYRIDKNSPTEIEKLLKNGEAILIPKTFTPPKRTGKKIEINIEQKNQNREVTILVSIKSQ